MKCWEQGGDWYLGHAKDNYPHITKDPKQWFFYSIVFKCWQNVTKQKRDTFHFPPTAAISAGQQLQHPKISDRLQNELLHKNLQGKIYIYIFIYVRKQEEENTKSGKGSQYCKNGHKTMGYSNKNKRSYKNIIYRPDCDFALGWYPAIHCAVLISVLES